jgi:Gpi18-like mannosyltransferase
MIKSNSISKGVLFATTMWLSSRLVICIAMLFIATSLPAPPYGITPKFGWDVFWAWDSEWYEKIVTYGYEYVNDGKQHSIAFFPLLPLLIRLVMNFGLPFNVAGVLVNNLSFIAALIILYSWVEELYDTNAARWATATLAWCPLSVYGTVIYSEGLFFLCSTSALRAYHKQQYTWAGIWGALSTATRSPGLALIPAFLFTAFKERRGIKAYLAGVFTATGILLYSLYCQIRFNDFLAFIHVQKGWRDSSGFAWEGWKVMLTHIIMGETNLVMPGTPDIWYPIRFGVLVIGAFLLWYFRKKIGVLKADYGIFILWLLLWLMARDNLVRITIVYGGLILLWFSRAKLPLVTVIYGFFTYLLILNTGLVLSVERYAYGIVSLSMALGLILARHPRWGYMIMSFFAIILAQFAIMFSQRVWLS